MRPPVQAGLTWHYAIAILWPAVRDQGMHYRAMVLEDHAFLLAELNEPTLTGDVPPVSYFIRFDQALSFTPDYVPALAAYICYPSYPELQLLSVKIIATLSSSAALSQLALLIDRSSESIRILEGYLRALDTHVAEDVDGGFCVREGGEVG